MPSSIGEAFLSAGGFTVIQRKPTSSWTVEFVANSVLRSRVVPFGSEQEVVGNVHVDTTTLMTHATDCCLHVQFTTGGLIAA